MKSLPTLRATIAKQVSSLSLLGGSNALRRHFSGRESTVNWKKGTMGG